MQTPSYNDELLRLSSAETVDFWDSLSNGLSSLLGIKFSEETIQAMTYLLWGAIIIFIGWIVWREYKAYKSEKTDNDTSSWHDDETLQGSASDANIKAHNIDTELSNALKEQDYATAINMLYLRTLRDLNNVGRIEWMPHKTPMMYVRELNEAQMLLHELTMRFLYIKYGHYNATQETYDNALKTYNAIMQAGKGGDL